MNHRILIFAMIVSMLSGWSPGDAAARQQPMEAPAAPETLIRFTVPLENGELNFAVLVGLLADELGFDGKAIAEAGEALIPVRTPLGAGTFRLVSAVTDGIVKINIEPEQVEVTIDRVRFRQEQALLHKALQRLIEHVAPEAAALARAQFGTVVHPAGGEPAPLTSENAPRHAVVLIHGLDDVGRLWRALIPALHGEGYDVCEITYPDDQAIADSTAYVATLFDEMRRAGVERVSIVAHSMGSLISRDLLTGESWYAGAIEGGERFPRVQRLIMLGPPNHGSKMALFRLGSEARDQVVRALSGDGLLVGGFFDGAGEAQDDLVPGSPYLTALNARPLPSGLPITIIAGSASPFESADIASLVERIDKLLVTKYGKAYEGSEVDRAMSDLVNGVGDGCVSIDCTRLDGVEDHILVRANHLTMIRPFGSGGGSSVPPAIPIILERLRRDRP